jgi:putative ABC transport system permease protein
VSLLARKLIRDGRRQPWQLGAVALTLGLGVAVFGAAYDAYRNLTVSYAEVYDRLQFADVTLTGGDTEQLVANLEAIDGVAAVMLRDQSELPFRVQQGAGASERTPRTLLGRVVAQPRGATVDQLLVEEGRGPGTGDPGDTGVTVERHMADHFDLAVGDTVDVFGADGWRPLTITGVAVSPEYLWPARDRQDVLSSPDDFGVLFAPPSLVDQLSDGDVEHQTLVRYASDAKVDGVEAQVRRAATDAGVGDVMTQRDQPSNAALHEDVRAFGEMAVLFPLLFLVAGSLAAYVLLGRLVRAQRAQLGMLAANGYPRGRILRHYLAFGAAIGLVGGAAGALGGVGLAHWLTSTYTSSLGIPLSVTRFRPLTPLIGLVVGALAGTVAAAGPARAAVRVPPAEAMRGIAPVGVSTGRFLERLPGLRGLPVRFRMVIRNALRSPRRSLSTGVGVILAAVLVLSSLALLDTFEVVLDEQFHGIQREDARLYLDGTTPGVVAAVSDVNGVAAAEPSLGAPVALTTDDHRYQTTLEGFETDTRMHRFPQGLPASGVLLGRALHDLLGVDVGDEVSVATAGAEPVPVEVAGFVDEPIGSLAYASLDQTRRLVGTSATQSVLVRYRSAADHDAVHRRLAAVPGVVATRDTRGSEEAVSNMLGFFYAIVGVMLLFGAILAFVVLYNTLSVNLADRTAELGTLRAAGARARGLALLVTGENVLLVIATIPLGLLAGWAVASGMMRSFNSDLWNFSVRIRVLTPIVVAAALVATTLVTYLPAQRHLRRLDVARIVRERAT